MDYKRFLNCIEKASRLAPDHPVLIYDLARAYALAGKPAEALDCLERVAAIGGIASFGAAREKDFSSVSDTDRFRSIIGRIESMKAPVINSEIAYKINERDLIPRSAAYDAATQTLFLGSLYKHKIVSLDERGAVKNFISEKQDQIGGVLGIKIDAKRRTLWAAANSGNAPESLSDIEEKDLWNSGVFKFDLSTGQLIKKYLLEQSPNAHLLNDLAVTSEGDLFITDTQEGAVYLISASSDEMKLFLKTPRLKFAGGIALSDNDRHLFVAHSLGIEVLDLLTRDSYPLAHPENVTLTGINGISFYRRSLIAHQTATLGRIVRYYLREDLRQIERSETLDAHRPDFNMPARGAVAGDLYYYVANSQLRSFSRGRIFPMNELRDVIILRAKL